MNIVTRALAVTAIAATAAVGGVATASAAPARGDSVQAARGYVTQGNLRQDPNLGAGIKVTIYNQWVDINCWLDGGDNGFGSNRWFKATYYSQVGYLSSGVVSQQPAVGHC
ncbi:hypothetical protein [Amycolatopsis sp. NPDC049159]|uniref:hypothetical protein n=1 Tax=Amycolatopsis sp. NPDC049159 TaxID=3157210 RepID=UPI00340D0BA6